MGAFSPDQGTALPAGLFRDLFEAWQSWPRAGGDIPLRSSFDPIDFLGLLNHLTLFQATTDDPPRFQVKLVGNEIVDSMGTNTTGKMLDELPGTAQVRARCTWLHQTRRPYFIAKQPVTWIEDKEHRQYDCLGLPLTETGERVDEILYLMLFHRRVGGQG